MPLKRNRPKTKPCRIPFRIKRKDMSVIYFDVLLTSCQVWLQKYILTVLTWIHFCNEVTWDTCYKFEYGH